MPTHFSSDKNGINYDIERPGSSWRLFARLGACESSETAVLIVPPFGEEGKVWRRSIFVLSEMLPPEGIECLSFDLSSCGESEGYGVDFSCWIDDVKSGFAFLESRPHIKRVVPVGIRVGAALSLLAAGGRGRACRILIDPVLDIRSYFRNILRRDSLRGVLYGDSASRRGDTIDVEGCRMVRDFVERLEPFQDELDRALQGRGAGSVLVRSGRYEKDEYFTLDGMSDLEECHDLAADWGSRSAYLTLAERCIGILDGMKSGRTACARASAVPGRGTVRVLSDITAYGESVTIPCASDRLRGSLLDVAGSGITVLFIHGRAGYRIGPNRIFCDAANALYRRGFSSLRFDFRGWGDSAGDGYDPDVDLDDDAIGGLVRDVETAAAYLAAAKPDGRIVLCGICLGGYVALRSIGALRDRLSGVVLLSPYFMGVENRMDFKLRSLTSLLAVYARKVRRPETWRRLLGGNVSMRGIARVFRARLLSRVPEPESPAGPAVENAGIPCLQVYSELDPYMAPSRREISASFGNLLTSEYLLIENTDHNFGDGAAKTKAVEAMVSFLERLAAAHDGR